MQEKMAAFRAAQAQAKADAERVGQFSAASGSTGATQLSPEAQARFNLAKNPTEKLAIINEDLKARGGERAKAEFNPSSMDRKEALIRNPNNGQIELREVNAFEYRDLESKGLIVPASQMYGAGTGAKPAAPVAGGQPTITAADIRRVESGGNPAAVSSKGAEGTMQVMPATQKDPGFGVKPAANKSPEELERTGVDYFAAMKRVYGDDVTAAIAYNMGPGATDKWIKEGRKFDQLPAETQDYVKKLTAGKAPSATATTTTAPGIPDISKIKAERELIKTEETAAATKRGTSSEERRVAFEADTDPTTVTEALISTKRVQDLVSRDPSLSGVLTAPGVPAAIAKVLEKGVGNFGIADIEQAVYQALPTTTRKSLGERNELITYLARIELQAAKLIKGQGQITEGEREILARASSSIKDPAESIYKKAKMLEAISRKNEELGKLYRSADPTSTRNFRQFIDKDETVAKLNAQYRKELTAILNEEVDFSKQRAAAGGKKVQHPADIQAIINKGKPQ
jgi:soluble lytic murein transglycosylase-like protein